MARLLLIRHAESEGNRARVYTAHPEVPLTAHGHEQARAAAARVRAEFAPGRLVSSPYARARQTAAILGEALGLPVEIEPALRERDYGRFAGLPYDTPREGYDPAAFWTWRPPGGESLEEVAARAGVALDRIAGASPDETIVVGHGALMVALWWHVTRVWRPGGPLPNAGILVVEHEAGAWRGLRPLEPDSLPVI